MPDMRNQSTENHSPKKVVIIGAGGFGREVAWLIERINNVAPTWQLLGFVDDDESKFSQKFYGLSVLGDIDWLNQQPDDLCVICSVGKSIIRKTIVSRIRGKRFATLIDPDVICSDSVNIGEGSIICAGSILTVDISIGSHTIINLDCTVGHDAVISDFVTVYPSVNISGNVCIESCVEIGTGSQIIQGLHIAENTIIGAGAVVIRDLPSNCTAVGSPAKPIKFSI